MVIIIAWDWSHSPSGLGAAEHYSPCTRQSCSKYTNRWMNEQVKINSRTFWSVSVFVHMFVCVCVLNKSMKGEKNNVHKHLQRTERFHVGGSLMNNSLAFQSNSTAYDWSLSSYILIRELYPAIISKLSTWRAYLSTQMGYGKILSEW